MFLSSGSGVVLGIYLCLFLFLNCYSPQRGIKKGARLCLLQSSGTDSHPRSLVGEGPSAIPGAIAFQLSAAFLITVRASVYYFIV